MSVRAHVGAGTIAAMDETVPSARGRRGLVVALDGPGSSGKSTVGALAARELGFRFCDTGLLYRAVTWLALRRGLVPFGAADPGAHLALAQLVGEVAMVEDAEGRLGRVLVDGIDVSAEIATAAIDEHVSAVARVAEVRTALLARQRELVQTGAIIMAGRDIGTVVLPDSDLKIYLDASVEERARRRAEERGLAPDDPEALAILSELRRRDTMDSTRPVAPLRVAPDAVVIVTDGLERHQSVALVVAAIRAVALSSRGTEAPGDTP